MGRPAGSKNKPKDNGHVETREVPIVHENPIRGGDHPSDSIRYDVILAVRNLRSGQFKGLWELVELNNDLTRKQVLTDANSRQSLLNLVHRRVMRIVVNAAL